jgi:hypothetical protein
MKRVKLFFTAVAVLSVVGGALAFKTLGAGNVVYCNTALETPTCAAEPDYSTISGVPISVDPTLYTLDHSQIGTDCSDVSTCGQALATGTQINFNQ